LFKPILGSVPKDYMTAIDRNFYVHEGVDALKGIDCYGSLGGP
jgi:hypothetical protein